MRIFVLCFLFVCVLLSCVDERYYDGKERYVVTGIIVNDNKPLANAEVNIVSVDWVEGKEIVDLRRVYPRDYHVVNSIYTEADGSFKLGFPGGKYLYLLLVNNYEQVVVNGVDNKGNYLFHLGTIDVAKPISNEE
ncbi:hypothetical protein [Myroides fluvii]|uniref:hypothetical protein n=1 Tax=Myroides fluvii TaxID=2572594 RepID=UPI00131B288C|nr:hypothetical protein [Myroides fluvii]